MADLEVVDEGDSVNFTTNTVCQCVLRSQWVMIARMLTVLKLFTANLTVKYFIISIESQNTNLYRLDSTSTFRKSDVAIVIS